VDYYRIGSFHWGGFGLKEEQERVRQMKD